ncbi:MAG TPA: alpha/beta hydrolase [Chitinophagaceae bacterium]
MKQLLLLHGAIGAKDQLRNFETTLKDSFDIHTINFSGHGGEPFTTAEFSIPHFANEVLHYLDKNNIESINLFGYSMGGYVAMYLAKHHPAKVESVITLATKFHWDETTAAKEMKMLDAEIIQQKVPAFAEQLKQRHAPNDWKELLQKTRELLFGLGQNNTLQLADYSSINSPCLLLLGDHDKMITLDETVNVYKQLPKGQLGILPATAHPIEQINVSLLASLIMNFLNSSELN